MKKLKLKKFVMPTVYFSLVCLLVISTYMTFANSNKNKGDIKEDINYVSNIILSNEVPVISTDKVIGKPYSKEDITIGKYYYDYTDNQDNQKKAIIFYEDSYIQNSGVDYISKEVFDVVSIYEGTVTKVEENELIGKSIEIKHDNGVISIYQSLSETNVKEGDTIKEGQIIGKSGKSKINSDLGNHLHFELYVNGKVVDPEECYNKKLTEL